MTTGVKRFLSWVVLLLASLCLIAAKPAKSRDLERTIRVDGRSRSFLVHVPPSNTGKTRVPLVLLFHGGGGNAGQAAGDYGMSAIADREGFLVVYPNGTGRLKKRLFTWNVGDCCGYAEREKVDDIAFIRSMLMALKREFAIDSNRIYATGISNGAMMSYRLACEMPEVFAAIAPVAGALNGPCTAKTPVSVVIFHGLKDLSVPYDGGVGPRALDPRVDKPVSHAVDVWVKANSCSKSPERSVSGNIIRDTHGGCTKGTEVVLYTIKDGGHAWPGAPPPSLNFLDEPTQEISASEVMWGFFKQHPKN